MKELEIEPRDLRSLAPPMTIPYTFDGLRGISAGHGSQKRHANDCNEECVTAIRGEILQPAGSQPGSSLPTFSKDYTYREPR